METDDVDLLVAEIVAGTNGGAFDLSGDGTVDVTDLTTWLSQAATENGFGQAYVKGDSNLDGSVNSTDLNNLALNWQQDVALWSGGDFTADDVVNSGDLNDLALSWRHFIPMTSSADAPLPEPSALLLMLFGLALVWRRPSRN